MTFLIVAILGIVRAAIVAGKVALAVRIGAGVVLFGSLRS